ncbi:hypothetical protein MsAm2_06250 [Methanolapillus ohkumae]|uniref:Uncharacterized protein n=1 Tax=Methanolapillus ohkumae TaxID=3028298 RepID=A0AA96V6P3_9EURY|nr:hypothetical protein MsAm2_06250 [Methanosarcinaceae archaeon Am2]
MILSNDKFILLKSVGDLAGFRLLDAFSEILNRYNGFIPFSIYFANGFSSSSNISNFIIINFKNPGFFIVFFQK